MKNLIALVLISMMCFISLSVLAETGNDPFGQNVLKDESSRGVDEGHRSSDEIMSLPDFEHKKDQFNESPKIDEENEMVIEDEDEDDGVNEKEKENMSSSRKERVDIDQDVRENYQWRFGFGLSYSLFNSLEFDSITTSQTGSYSAKADLIYDDVFSLEADVRRMRPHSWGFIGGVMYDFERKLKSGTVSVGSFSSNFNAEDPSKIQSTVVYASAVYQWESLYLPFGINVSAVSFTPPNSYYGSTESKGGIGGQLGVGWYATSFLALELMSRVVSVKLKTSSSTANVDFGTGYLQSLQATVKYVF